jgi:hypothetical protein
MTPKYARLLLHFARSSCGVALAVAAGTFALGAYAQDAPAEPAEHPWIIRCTAQPCASLDSAIFAFLHIEILLTHDAGFVLPFGLPLGLSARDWSKLVAFAERWSAEDVANQFAAKRAFCARATSITTRSELAAAAADQERAVAEFRTNYFRRLGFLLTQDGLARVTAEIDKLRYSMASLEIDRELYFEHARVDPAEVIERTCNPQDDDVPIREPGSII